MAIGTYQQQYYYNFYGVNGDLNRVEIWNQTIVATITAEEIRGEATPFIVEMPSLSDKFQPVRGTGCEININSTSDRKFLTSLYHIGYKDILIKHYVNGSVNWVGYMNSETYRESYSELTNYPVQLTGNDGFALMDRFHFNDPTTATPYVGIKSQWEIIQLILAKIGLPFTALNVNISTGLGYIISYSIFHNTYVDCANFYKEDGSPETLRAVLEAMLLPYGAFIIQHRGSLYITDIDNVTRNTSFSFASFSIPSGYTSTTWTNTGDVTSNQNTLELSSIGYAGTGSEIELSGGKNKQTVTYSPYPYSTFILNSIANISEFQYVGASFIAGTYLCSVNDVAKYLQTKSLASCTQWNGTFESVRISTDATNSTYTTLAALKSAIPYGANNITYITTSNGFHYRWNGFDYVKTDASLSYGSAENIHALLVNSMPNSLCLSLNNTKSLVIPKIKTTAGFGAESIVSGAGILIKGKFNYVPTDTYPVMHIDSMRICMRVSVGSNYYNGIDWSSTSSATYFYPRLSQKNDEYMSTTNNCDSNGNFTMYNLGNNGADGIFLPATQDLSGILTVEFWSQMYASDNIPVGSTIIKMTWLNNVSVSVVQADGTEIPTSDAEYWGYLDQSFKDEGTPVKLICGTETSIADRGKMLYLNGSVYSPITSWVRGGQTSCIEKLLLNSLSSNYQAGFYSMSNLTLNINQRQTETITLSGASGTATIIAIGVSKVLTFATSLTVTATNFVTANASFYLAVGLTLTSTGSSLIFTSTTDGFSYVYPTITALTGTLIGSVKHSKGMLDPFNIVNDSTYISGHDMMLSRYKIDYSESTINCDLIEVIQDSLTIV